MTEASFVDKHIIFFTEINNKKKKVFEMDDLDRRVKGKQQTSVQRHLRMLLMNVVRKIYRVCKVVIKAKSE